MNFIIIMLLIMWLITLIGWFVENLYSRLLIKHIRNRIRTKIKRSQTIEEQQGWIRALKLFEREVER